MARNFNTFCCAKTFLLGEYSVLKSKKALLLLTKPTFSASFSLSCGTSNVPIHCKSFVENEAPFLKDYAYEFCDPYHGIGGLGASSAEFLFFLRAAAFFSNAPPEGCKKSYHDYCLSKYLDYTWDGTGVAPSGIDLISQDYSQVVLVDFSRGRVLSQGWNVDARLALVHTGRKLATHEHLQNINSVPSLPLFGDIIDFAWEAIHNNSVIDLATQINSASKMLYDNGLVASHTQKIINAAMNRKIFYAAKGCGAMGSDIILFLYNDANSNQAKDFFVEHDLTLVATDYDL